MSTRTVVFDYRQPDLSGTDAAAGGYVKVQPFPQVERSKPGYRLIPEQLMGRLVEGVAEIPLECTDTYTTGCWVVESPLGVTRFITVPAGDGAITADQCPDVNPSSFAPVEDVIAAWTAVATTATEAAAAAEAAQAAAEAVPTTTDGIVTALVSDPGSAMSAALSSTYGAPQGRGLERFAAKIGTGQPAVVALAADSTGDETSEWFWRGLTMWAALRTDWACSGYYAYGDSGPYTGPTAIQTAGKWTPFWADSFSRSGDVYQSTADYGGTYGGGSNGWVADGTKAVAGSSVGNSVSGTSSTRGGRRRLRALINFDGTPGAGSDRGLNVQIGESSSNCLRGRLTMTSAGTQTWYIQAVVSGSASTIATGTGTPLVSGANQFEINLDVDPDNSTVTWHIGSLSVSATLTAPQVAAVDGSLAFFFGTAGGAACTGAISAEWLLNELYSTASQTVTAYNGAKAGSTLQHQQDRLAALYPVPVDVLFISHGHNYTTGTAADFLTALDTFLTAYKAAQPNSGVVICSQNPEFTPASTVSAHAARNAALKAYAAAKGYGYLPIFEAYTEVGDGARWLVKEDGIHPRTAYTAADPNNGSYLGAMVLRDYLNA